LALYRAPGIPALCSWAQGSRSRQPLVKLKDRLRRFCEMKFGDSVGESAFWLAALLILFAPLLSLSQQHAPPSLPAANSARHSRGQQLFATTCAACHGLDGMGGARAPNIVTNS